MTVRIFKLLNKIQPLRRQQAFLKFYTNDELRYLMELIDHKEWCEANQYVR